MKIIGRRDMVGTKLEWGGGGNNDNVVTMLNDMKDFCCLDLKCSAMFCFTLNFHRICLNLFAILFMA